MILRPLCLLASIVPFALADVEFTSPAAGSSQAASASLSIAWKDSGDTPSISDLTTYQLFLVGGGNDASTQMIATLVSSGDFSTGNSAEGTVSANFAGSVTNGYYLKMVSVASAGGTVTNYSPRFSLTGMTGTFPTAMETAIEGISSDTDVPDTENDVTDSTSDDSTASAAGTGSYAMAYTLQTGATKYAPMPSVPPTKITVKTATPLNPTSAYSIATTYLGTPYAVWTNTESQTFSTSSVENTQSAVAGPTDAKMLKFLKRWEDAEYEMEG